LHKNDVGLLQSCGSQFFFHKVSHAHNIPYFTVRCNLQNKKAKRFLLLLSVLSAFLLVLQMLHTVFEYLFF